MAGVANDQGCSPPPPQGIKRAKIVYRLLGGERACGDVGVVLLVDVLVERFGVQQSVSRVEHALVDDEADSELVPQRRPTRDGSGVHGGDGVDVTN